MSSFLRELERLTRSESGTFRLTIQRGVTRASFKRPRRAAEVVQDFATPSGESPSSADGILHELLVRLGFTGLPTTDLLVEQMNPRQRQRCRELIGELRVLRAEVLNTPPPSAYEPRLASPRSGLNRELVQGTRE